MSGVQARCWVVGNAHTATNTATKDGPIIVITEAREYGTFLANVDGPMMSREGNVRRHRAEVDHLCGGHGQV